LFAFTEVTALKQIVPVWKSFECVVVVLQDLRQRVTFQGLKISHDCEHCRVSVGRTIPGQARRFSSEPGSFAIATHKFCLPCSVDLLGRMSAVREESVC